MGEARAEVSAPAISFPPRKFYGAAFIKLRCSQFSRAATSDGVTRTIDATGDLGRGAALALTSDGRPVVAYLDTTNLALKLYVCTNADCSVSTRRILDDARDVTTAIDLVIRNDGRPLVVYGDSTSFQTTVFDCADAGCSSGRPRTVVSSSTFGGSDLALALDPAGLPVIAKGGNGGAGVPVQVVRCADASCAGANPLHH